jgi:integrase/recombinase XerD
MRRPTARRDRALILVLLDTGLRASELCALTVGDVDLKSGQVVVKHGEAGGAKGGKGRVVYLGKAARRALWRYLATRDDGKNPDRPLFLGKLQRQINKRVLRQLIARLGEKADVAHAHPQRFRHSFAITYLRSGGDLFTLQALLGHRTLEMVQHYAQIAQIDVEQAHRRASPVDNWRL